VGSSGFQEGGGRSENYTPASQAEKNRPASPPQNAHFGAATRNFISHHGCLLAKEIPQQELRVPRVRVLRVLEGGSVNRCF
jgi:hypothetical protein